MRFDTPAPLAFLMVLLCTTAVAAQVPHRPPDAESVRRIGRMMSSLAAESRRDARLIKKAYGDLAWTSGLRDRAALEASLDAGHISLLPADTMRFNVHPRLEGAHPIGEKDLAHQSLYVAARRGTLGLLFHVAAQVRSTPLDVTSLVRHHSYQRALQRTNPNARTSVPTHALGLAFDISVLHVTPRAAAEIRDVLRRMRRAGVLFFIAETRQLVFHVVPTPERLGFYAALYDGLTQVPGPARAVTRDTPLKVKAPPPPDTAWLDARAAGGNPEVALAYFVLAGSIAVSGVRASLRRQAP